MADFLPFYKIEFACHHQRTSSSTATPSKLARSRFISITVVWVGHNRQTNIFLAFFTLAQELKNHSFVYGVYIIVIKNWFALQCDK